MIVIDIHKQTPDAGIPISILQETTGMTWSKFQDLMRSLRGDGSCVLSIKTCSCACILVSSIQALFLPSAQVLEEAAS